MPTGYAILAILHQYLVSLHVVNRVTPSVTYSCVGPWKVWCHSSLVAISDVVYRLERQTTKCLWQGASDLTLKTTEQNLIVCSGKSEAEVQDTAQGIVLLRVTTNRRSASHGRSVIIVVATNSPSYQIANMTMRKFAHGQSTRLSWVVKRLTQQVKA